MPTFRWRPGSPPLSSPQPSAPAMRTTPAGCWPTSATSTGCWPSGRRAAGKPTPAAPRSIRTSPPTGSSSARCAGWLSMPCSPSCRSRRCTPGSLRRSPPTPPGLSPALRPTTCWYARLATATTSSRTGSAASSEPRFLPAQSNARAEEVGMTRLDRPWHRPGAAWYALGRLPGLLHPPVSVYEPPAGSLSVLRDLPVVMRDGTTLRVNVVLPADAGRFPVLMSAHPYGKDNLPQRRGRGYRVSFLYRMLRQTALVRFSSLTGWEAPDPAWWAAQGYAVVNCDLRGAGTSEGSASLLSDQEGEDVYDLIEWAAGQPWSTGAVGMIGVSYLAISQWKAAALQPPSLKAICPWEGLTDAYRDLCCTGAARSAAGKASPAPTGSSTPTAPASGPRFTPPRPARPSSGSSTATCAATTSPRRRGSGSKSAKAATPSPASARRTAGRWTARNGGRSTSPPPGSPPRRQRPRAGSPSPCGRRARAGNGPPPRTAR